MSVRPRPRSRPVLSGGVDVDEHIHVPDGMLRILHLCAGEPHESHTDLVRRLGYAFNVKTEPLQLRSLWRAICHARKLAHSDGWQVVISESPSFEAWLLPFLDRNGRTRLALDADGAAWQIQGATSTLDPRHLLRRHRWHGVIVVGNPEAAYRFFGETKVVTWTPSLRWGDPVGRVVSAQAGPIVAAISAVTDYKLWFKGLDRLAEISQTLVRAGNEPVQVFGTCADRYRERFAADLSFCGWAEPAYFLNGASILLHPSRRDPFAVAVIEAMLAGVVPIVGSAGSAYLVSNVEPRLVIEEPDEAISAISWIRSLSPPEFCVLAERLRAEALSYIEWASSDDSLQPIRQLLARVAIARGHR